MNFFLTESANLIKCFVPLEVTAAGNSPILFAVLKLKESLHVFGRNAPQVQAWKAMIRKLIMVGADLGQTNANDFEPKSAATLLEEIGCCDLLPPPQSFLLASALACVPLVYLPCSYVLQ